MAKKINTGTEKKRVKNSVGDVVLSELDKDTYMIRTEMLGNTLSFVIISKYAAQMLGISHEKTTIEELEKQGKI